MHNFLFFYFVFSQATRRDCFPIPHILRVYVLAFGGGRTTSAYMYVRVINFTSSDQTVARGWCLARLKSHISSCARIDERKAARRRGR